MRASGKAKSPSLLFLQKFLLVSLGTSFTTLPALGANASSTIGTRILCKSDLYNASLLTSLRSDSSPRYRASPIQIRLNNHNLTSIDRYQVILGNNFNIDALIESNRVLYRSNIEIGYNSGNALPVALLPEMTSSDLSPALSTSTPPLWIQGHGGFVYLDRAAKEWIWVSLSGGKSESTHLGNQYQSPALGPNLIAFADSAGNIMEYSLNSKTSKIIFRQTQSAQVLKIIFAQGRWIWLQENSNKELELLDSQNKRLNLTRKLSVPSELLSYDLSEVGIVLALSFDQPKLDKIKKPGFFWKKWQDDGNQTTTEFRFNEYSDEILNRFAKLELAANLESIKFSPFDNRIYLSPQYYGGVFSFDIDTLQFQLHATEGGFVRCYQISIGPEAL